MAKHETHSQKKVWTHIYVKPKHSESGIKELVRIIYNPYQEPAKNIMREWVTPENWYKCYAYNTV